MKMFRNIIFTVCFFIATSFNSSAQDNLKSMISAERSFAKLALDSNTKLAFIIYTDHHSIVFDKAIPVDAWEKWNLAKVSKNKLIWQPAFAGIASSGDIGFTTGPWIFKVNDKQLAAGEFSTVWGKDSKGNWKFLVDIGISHDSVFYSTTELKVKVSTPDHKKGKIKNLPEFNGTEEKFLVLLKSNAKQAYTTYADADAVLLRSDELPYNNSVAKDSLLHKKNIYSYKQEASGVATSGDLAYVYGYCEKPAMKMNKEEMFSGNYLRVWMLKGNTWKIVLETLSF